jgi:phage-related minor tail protein
VGATIKIAVLMQAAKAKAEMNSLGDTAKAAGGKVQASLGNLAGMAKTGAIGAGLAIGGLLVGGIGQALEQGKLNAKLGVQLGLTKDEAAKVGKLSGQVYADGFGEDVGQVNEAVKGVYQQIGKGSAEWTKQTTQDVLTVANAFDQDLGGTTAAVGQLIKTGLAKNAKEALDVLTVGFQAGADKAGDLLDTFTEYGTQFRKMGIDGKQATGLLSQGLQAGARDADTVADAIKEFSIRAIDGSKATGEGFKGLGLSAKKMASDIAAGGPKANAALDTTLDRLRAVKDPVKRAQLAVQLFGTKAEDLGDALYALDPSKAVSTLGQVEGAAKQAGDTLQDNAGAKIDKFWRTLSQGGINVLGGIIGTFEGLGQKIGPVWDDLTTRAQGLGQKIGPVWDDLTTRAKPFIDALAAKLLPKIKELGNVIQNDVIPTLIDWYTALLPIYEWIAEKLWPIVSVVFGAIVDVIRGALQIITGVIKVATGILTGDWAKAWDGIKSILSGAWAIITSVVSVAWAAVKALTSAGIDGIVALAKGIGSRIMSAVSALGGLLLGWANSAWTTAKSAFTAGINVVLALAALLPPRVRTAISTLGSLILSIVNNAWTTTKAAFTSGVSNAVSAAKELPGRVRAGLGNLTSYLYSAGQNLIKGLLNGIKAMAGQAAAAARGVIDQAVSAARSRLGIGSPSKVFAKLGRQTGAGYVLGLEDEVKAAQRAAERLVNVPEAIPTGRTSIDVTRPVNGSSSTPIVIQFAPGGDPLMDAIWEQLRKRVRVTGGNVQLALGR